MIHFHDGNVGIGTPKICGWKIELWFCHRGSISPHTHRNIDSKIVMLIGEMIGKIGDRVGPPRKFKGYRIPRGVVHSAELKTFCLFMNVEKWVNGFNGSACTDFEVGI